jgi:hypothetical protein
MTFGNSPEVYPTKGADLRRNCCPFNPDVLESLSEDTQNSHKASEYSLSLFRLLCKYGDTFLEARTIGGGSTWLHILTNYFLKFSIPFGTFG